jgi:hypothetical protein
MCCIPISSSQRSHTPSIATPIFASQFGVYVCVVIILFTVRVSTLDSFVFLYHGFGSIFGASSKLAFPFSAARTSSLKKKV